MLINEHLARSIGHSINENIILDDDSGLSSNTETWICTF